MGVLWSDFILFFMGMFPSKNKKLMTKPNTPYIFVANHISMIDVMLLVSPVRKNPLVFIGKKELEKIPLFGSLIGILHSKAVKKVSEQEESAWNCSCSLRIPYKIPTVQKTPFSYKKQLLGVQKRGIFLELTVGNSELL